jgi:3-methyladenine DNA glycosylase/8-oxoguanine DNA glycosylase
LSNYKGTLLFYLTMNGDGDATYNTITSYIRNTPTEYYTIPQKTMYHNLISLITSQRISFNVSRQLRKKLMDMHPTETTNYDPFVIAKLDLKEIGIGLAMACCIQEVTKIAQSKDDLHLSDVTGVKGIGAWTINALKIMHDLDSNVFLSEDAWIRQRLSQITKSSSNLTKAQCDKLTSKWDNKTKISLFLWRLQKTGADKIANGALIVAREDFL